MTTYSLSIRLLLLRVVGHLPYLGDSDRVWTAGVGQPLTEAESPKSGLFKNGSF